MPSIGEWRARMTFAVRDVMRSMRAESDRQLAVAWRLSPRYGEVAVGGGHTDAFAVGEALAVMLDALGKGQALDAARDAGRDAARAIYRAWNRKREWQVHRWECAADGKLDYWYRELRAVGVR